MPSDEPTTLPLYRQIGDLLLREIDAGRLIDGQRLDPERELAARLGTSVGTLRKALSFLAEKGLLDRRQGSGNYVRTVKRRDNAYAFFRIELIAGGGEPTAEIISVNRLKKPSNAPAFGASKEAHRIRRVRRLDGVVAVLEEIWLDGAQAKTLDRQSLRDSLYTTYRDQLGLWIARAEDRVWFEPAPPWAPPEFGCKRGEMCGFVERVSWSQTGARVEWSLSWFDAKVARYVQRLK
ncbi:MAG: GntR family transcriptional regulator [Pseudomonadota bacterium]